MLLYSQPTIGPQPGDDAYFKRCFFVKTWSQAEQEKVVEVGEALLDSAYTLGKGVQRRSLRDPGVCDGVMFGVG